MPGDVGVAALVHGNAGGVIFEAAPQIGGVDQLRPFSVNLADKTGYSAQGTLVQGPGSDFEIDGFGLAGHISLPGAVHRDGPGNILIGATQVSGVEHGIARRVKLDDKGVLAALVGADGWVGDEGQPAATRRYPSHKRCRPHPPQCHWSIP